MTLVRRCAAFLALIGLMLGTGSIQGYADAAPASPDGVEGTDWWAAVQRGVQRAEYQITWQEGTTLPDLDAAYQAPNRAHNLRTYFVSASGPSGLKAPGIRVVPREGGTAAWEWGLSWVRAGAIETLGEAALTPNGSRIEYRRATASGVELAEWYVNDERGLAQGLIVPEALSPARRGSTELALDLAVGGDLAPSLVDDGSAGPEAIEFSLPGGAPVLRYGDLSARDAAGRALSTRLDLVSLPAGHAIRVTVDAAGAAYPLTIQSRTTSPSAGAAAPASAAWTVTGGKAGVGLGASVGTAGDVNGDGYADVFVGAPAYDGGQPGEGWVAVYHGGPAGLAQTPAWSVEGQQVMAEYGDAVSTAGDVNGDGYADLAIGADWYSVNQGYGGQVVVYHGGPAGLAVTPAWSADGDQMFAGLGGSVSTAGDVNGDGYADLAVGAPQYDVGPAGQELEDAGRAYVYHGSASGLRPSPAWTADGDQELAEFGASVGMAGDVDGDGYADLAVSAYRYDAPSGGGPLADAGRVAVYHGGAAGLAPTAAWTADGDQAGALYGYAAGTAGDVNGDGYADLAVGAHRYDVPSGGGPLADAGRVVVYHGGPAGLAAAAAWTADGDQAEALYGYAAGTAGDVNGDGYADLVVGAYQYDGAQIDGGQATVYYGGAAGLAPAPAWSVQGDQAQGYLGASAGTAGDVNGDGHADLVVGAVGYDAPAGGGTLEDAGQAAVYLGAGEGLVETAGWSFVCPQDGAALGYGASTAGDVNGDGYADFAVGAVGFDAGRGEAGRVYVFYGSPSGLSATPDWIEDPDWGAGGNPAGSLFGGRLGTAGDVNGDGYDDLIVGAFYYDNGQLDEGKAFVYHGGPSGLAPVPAWTAESNQAGAWFGSTVGTAGDVNGDGYADVYVGAPKYDGLFEGSMLMDQGRAYVYYGSETGLGATAAWTAESGQAGAHFGGAVDAAGDVNGDGYADLLVGAYMYDVPFGNGLLLNVGRAFVYHGGPSGLAPAPAWTADGAQPSSQFGATVDSAGDVNGDGYADVVVSARWYDSDYPNAGRATVYHGGPGGLSPTPNWTVDGDQAAGYLSNSVGTAGDVNGDGYADLALGAYYYSNGQFRTGRGYVYYGSAAGLGSSADWSAFGSEYDERFAWWARTAGDVNGDGYADLAVTSPLYGDSQGRVALYYGGGGPGLSLTPRQRRSDDSAPLAHLGRSEQNDFRLTALGRTPFGRGKVKLEWEAKPLGTPFDGTGLGRSAAWIDAGTAGSEITGLVTGLQQNTAYHWRARVAYSPATTPFQHASRWVTAPWNGWQEQDLRTGSRPALVGFGSPAYRAGENEGIATITVTLDEPSGELVQVDCKTSDGTAQAPWDYRSVNQTLSFPAGTTVQSFYVLIIDDGRQEGDETLTLTLSNPRNASLDGARNPVTLTIRDINETYIYLPLALNRYR